MDVRLSLTRKEDAKLTRIGIVVSAIFGTLTLIVFSRSLISTDVTVFYAINRFAMWQPLSDLLVLASVYGREVFWVGVLIVLWFLGGKANRKTAYLLILIFLVLFMISISLKTFLYRPRPYETLKEVQLLLSPLADSSFPSGHALIVMAGATTAWIRLRKLYATPLVIESVLVAFSRIYVGVHYPLDVVAGSLLGVCVTCLVLARINSIESLFRYLRHWRVS